MASKIQRIFAVIFTELHLMVWQTLRAALGLVTESIQRLYVVMALCLHPLDLASRDMIRRKRAGNMGRQK